jgi:hypothetical protein
MWVCPNTLIVDATKLGGVVDIMSCQLLMKSSNINMVVGQNGWNMVRYIQREEGVRGMGLQEVRIVSDSDYPKPRPSPSLSFQAKPGPTHH